MGTELFKGPLFMCLANLKILSFKISFKLKCSTVNLGVGAGQE